MIAGAKPFIPKNPNGELLVLVIGRISTEYQNIENIDASYRYVREYLARIYQGPMDLRLLGEQASGMRTDRRTIREAEDLIATGKVDLVIAEDLARIFRNPRHQYNFVQDAVDARTRVICVGDNLDTADENWEIMLGAASLRHGSFIPDTRRRVRRTATDSFHKGGMVLRLQFGYRKLSKEDADSGLHGPKGLRIARIPELTPIIRDMRERIMQVPNFEALADWLNQERIPVGPSVRRSRWSGKMVAELLRDPLLSGTRRFRRLLYTPIFETGKHRLRSPMIAFAQANDWQSRFLSMLPSIRRTAEFQLARLDAEAKDDAIAEIIANCFLAYFRLVELGKESLAYPSVLAGYAVRQYRAGRRVGNRARRNDVYTRYSRKKNRHELCYLGAPAEQVGGWNAYLVDNSVSPVPDQAAFRIDFQDWLDKSWKNWPMASE